MLKVSQGLDTLALLSERLSPDMQQMYGEGAHNVFRCIKEGYEVFLRTSFSVKHIYCLLGRDQKDFSIDFTEIERLKNKASQVDQQMKTITEQQNKLEQLQGEINSLHKEKLS